MWSTDVAVHAKLAGAFKKESPMNTKWIAFLLIAVATALASLNSRF
jgi:hypothetical protein